MKVFNLEAEDKKHYSVRILPYRTMDNAIDGVVVGFLEITDLKRAERRLEESKLIAEGIVDIIREAFVVLDADLNIRSANGMFYALFKANPKDTLDRRIYDVGDGQWNIPQLRDFLQKIIPKNARVVDYLVEHDFPGIGHKAMLLNARRIPQTKYILLAIEDSTGREKEKHGSTR
jgi:two-component system, chemotaxis family, CheB/CheR fusion protein